MSQTFGGEWTEEKLEVMKRYFAAYAQALKNQRFGKWYVDAFAGSGRRTEEKLPSAGQEYLFGGDESDFARAMDGSVRIALQIDPPFERYVFVERSRIHAAKLQELKQEFPSHQIDVCIGDANEVLRALATSTNWKSVRAAVFIDPYGMQVNWDTLKALANTKAVDIALLFPTGPLNRMLVRDGYVPAEWARRIDDHLGPCDWQRATYQETIAPDLFTQQASKMTKQLTPEGLRKYVHQRLKTIFPFVSDTQLELRNSKGAVLYHLFIICANPSGAAISLADRLARSAMKLPSKNKQR